MKKNFLLLLVCFLHLNSFAQKEAMYWYFGRGAGFDFTSGNPETLSNGALIAREGSAVISDKQTGSLLFYANARNVWNRTHQRMPGSTIYPEFCDNSLTQSTLIVPYPGEEDLYYVFTLDYRKDSLGTQHDYCIGQSYYPNQNYLSYSLVDMRLDNGLGAVAAWQISVPLHTNLTEKLTAVPHTNGEDYWLITHEWNSDAFFVSLITRQGISAPAVYRIGSRHVQQDPDNRISTLDETKGYLKASPDGTKLASAVFGTDRPFDLFDFDASTGQISNYQNLGNFHEQYGVSFSPDNSKLYLGATHPDYMGSYDHWGKQLWQFDLSAGTATAIRASAKCIVRDDIIEQMRAIPTEFLGHFALQIGPDGKIYMAGKDFDGYSNTWGISYLLVICQPNEAGDACALSLQRFDFGSARIRHGLPNFLQSYFNQIVSAGCPPTTNCSPPDFDIYPNPTTGILTIQLNETCFEPFVVRIITVLGQVMGEQRIEKTLPKVLDIQHLAAGTYLVEMQFDNGQRVVKKIVKYNR